MNFELVVAMTPEGIIGNDNALCWHIPEDLVRFKQMTLHSIVVMGRKTFESLPFGPLKYRTNIVITRNTEKYANISNVIFSTMENVLENIRRVYSADKTVFIIGGSEIYREFTPQCSKLHITIVNENVDGNVYFPHDIKHIENHYVLENSTEIMLSEKNKVQYHYRTYVQK
jgi:dihydrofolate reductase